MSQFLSLPHIMADFTSWRKNSSHRYDTKKSVTVTLRIENSSEKHFRNNKTTTTTTTTTATTTTKRYFLL